MAVKKLVIEQNIKSLQNDIPLSLESKRPLKISAPRKGIFQHLQKNLEKKRPFESCRPLRPLIEAGK